MDLRTDNNLREASQLINFVHYQQNLKPLGEIYRTKLQNYNFSHCELNLYIFKENEYILDSKLTNSITFN